MKKKSVIVVLMFMILILCSGCQSQNEQICEKAYKAYHKGFSYAKKKEYDSAIKQFDIVINQNTPKLKLSDRTKKKIDVSMLTTQYVEAFYYKASLLEKKGENKLFISAYKDALEKDYKYNKTKSLNELDYFNRMNAHIKTQAYNDAIQDIEAARTVWSKKTKEIFMYNKIMIYEKQDDWSKAKIACEEYKAVFGEDKIKDDIIFLNTR